MPRRFILHCQNVETFQTAVSLLSPGPSFVLNTILHMNKLWNVKAAHSLCAGCRTPLVAGETLKHTTLCVSSLCTSDTGQAYILLRSSQTFHMHMPLISTMVWNFKRTSLLPRRYLGRIYGLLSLHVNSEWRVVLRRCLAARMTFCLATSVRMYLF